MPDSTTDDQTKPTARTLAVFGALVAARVAALAYVIMLGSGGKAEGITGDIRRFTEIATANGIPYRDFQVEYPPITFLLINSLCGPDVARNIMVIAISQFLCDVGIAALIGWAWGRRAAIAYLILGLPLMAWPFVYARIDLFTTLLAVAGLALLRKQSDRAGGALLAVAVLGKVWPIAVAPVLLIEKKTKGAVAFVVAGAVLGFAWLAVASGDGLQQVLSFREATGWQVESIPGALWHLRDPARIKFESGAFRTGVMPVWGRPLLTLISLAVMGAAWWLAARRWRRAGTIVLDGEAPLAAVLGLLLFAPILSPQYVVWFLPFAALLTGRRDWLIGGLTLAITALTALTYPFVLPVADGNVAAMVPALARNALLVALLVVAFQSLAGVRDHRRADADADAGVGDEVQGAAEPVPA